MVLFRCHLSRALEVVSLAVPWVGVVLSGSTLLPPPAAAEPPGAQPTHPGALDVPALEVPLVQLDVLVTDARGEPVTGLARDDFELLQDGAPVPLAAFSAPSAGPSEVGPAGGSPLQLVLYFHLQFLETGDLAGLSERLERFLREDLPPDARVLLAVANPDLRILQGFTSDREAILGRLEEVVELGGTSRLDAEYGAVLREIREQALKPVQEGRSEIREAIPRALLTRIGSVAEQAFRELGIAAASLTRLIAPLAGLPGRREVLVVSGRLPAQAGQSLFDAWSRAFNRNSSYWGDGRITGGVAEGVQFDTLPEGSSFLDTTRVLTGLTEIAAARGVVLHTLDVSTGRSRRTMDSGTGPVGRDSRTAERRSLGDRQALRLLAEKTGGRDLAGSAIEDGLSALTGDVGNRYVLAFVPPQGPDGRTHEIEVRLPEHRRLKVRHPPVYRALSRDQRTAERVMAALVLEAPAAAPSPPARAVPAAVNPLEAELEPVSSTTGPGHVAIRVAVRVPLANLALIPEGRVHRGQISIFSSSAETGESAPVAKAVVPVRVANDELLTVQGRHVEYLLERTPGSEARRLVVAVRDDFQDLTSVLVLDPKTAAGPEGPDAEGPVAALPEGEPMDLGSGTAP